MKERFFNFLKKNQVYEYVMNLIGGPTDINWDNCDPSYYVKGIILLIKERGYANTVDRIFLNGLDSEWQEELKKPQYTINNMPEEIKVGDEKYRLIITKSKAKYAACYMQYMPNAKCITSDKPFYSRVEDALQMLVDMLNNEDL